MQPLAIMKQIWTQMNGFFLEMSSKSCYEWFSGSELPTKAIKSVWIFFKFHLVLSQSYGAIYKQKELQHMLHS